MSRMRTPQAVSLTSPSYYQGKEKGWFWYEDPVAEETAGAEPLPETKPAAKAVEKPAEPEPKALSSAWFRKRLPEFRDKAIDNPTPENVKLYLYLQRVMMDKAETFAQASQVQVMSDAVLDENARRPVNSFGANAMDERASEGLTAAVKQLATLSGLWFFYRSDCTFCSKESAVLQGLMNTYGFKVMPIALDGLPLPNGDFKNFTVDQGQGQKMGVTTTPALFLVKPGAKGEIIPLGEGLLSGSEITERAVTLAHQRGWLSQSQFEQSRKLNSLVIDTQTLQGVGDPQLTKPAEFIDKLRKNLKAQQ